MNELIDALLTVYYSVKGRAQSSRVFWQITLNSKKIGIHQFTWAESTIENKLEIVDRMIPQDLVRLHNICSVWISFHVISYQN